MLVTKKVELLYSVEMTEDQARLIIGALSNWELFVEVPRDNYTVEQCEAMKDLRVSLLNA